MIFIEVNEVLLNVIVKVGGIAVGLSVVSVFLPVKQKNDNKNKQKNSFKAKLIAL
jgi:hypothetical protein